MGWALDQISFTFAWAFDDFEFVYLKHLNIAATYVTKRGVWWYRRVNGRYVRRHIVTYCSRKVSKDAGGSI